ncbi:hypothetical protein AAEX28_04780 [Lentisphaerota bacterium WC36G]|nr:hypothetical protein LJT99_07640 [Lentisphaerae bacterium WC36]
MKTHIAIDTGKSGAIAVNYNDGSAVESFNCPDTVQELSDVFKVIKAKNKGEIFCILEKVASMPGQGVKSMFSFGQNYGTYQGVLSALDIPFKLIRPIEWQKKVGGAPKDKKARKNYFKAYSQNLYPHLRATLKNGDALAMLSVVKEFEV